MTSSLPPPALDRDATIEVPNLGKSEAARSAGWGIDRLIIFIAFLPGVLVFRNSAVQRRQNARWLEPPRLGSIILCILFAAIAIIQLYRRLNNRIAC